MPTGINGAPYRRDEDEMGVRVPEDAPIRGQMLDRRGRAEVGLPHVKRFCRAERVCARLMYSLRRLRFPAALHG